MTDVNSRIAVLEEKIQAHERFLVEKRRKDDKIIEILDDIRAKQTRSNGFIAGIVATVSVIWTIIILVFDKSTDH